jgi:uncharacterized membrane protein
MNLAHIHIVLNHIPSLGSVAGLLMLAWAIYTKNNALKKSSFGFLVLIALATLPTYLSGNGARQIISKQPAMPMGIVEVHQNFAMLSLIAMTVAGTFAWFGLWEIRRFSRAGTLTTVGSLLTAAVASGFILYTGGLGGKISHPEIRTAADNAITEAAGWKPAIEEFLARSWVIPTVATLHYIGMVLLFGVSLVLILRVLGVLKSIPFSVIHRLLPVAIFGFVINVITGMLFYLQGPIGYLMKSVFQLKIACILLAAVPVLYFTVFDGPWQAGSNRNASALTKVAGICTFAFLVGAIIYGRLIYISN